MWTLFFVTAALTLVAFVSCLYGVVTDALLRDIRLGFITNY